MSLKTAEKSRLGFYYRTDTHHYRNEDLRIWLPHLQRIGASWLVVPAPLNRSIPEYFLSGLIGAGIEPILHLKHLPQEWERADLAVLLESYAHWGVRYAVLGDRPNCRSAWNNGRTHQGWAELDLVERFLDAYLPIAELARKAGLLPVLTPLEPGGDYWDTSFLRSLLRSMQRRGSHALLDQMIMGAYAFPGNRPLGWGAGGPERWPLARPYGPGPDQRGWRIFDWYLALAQAELGATRPVLLIGAGLRPGERPEPDRPAVNTADHTAGNMEIVRQVWSSENSNLPAVPEEVLACNFWLLTDTTGSPHTRQAWFQPDGTTLPIVRALADFHTVRLSEFQTASLA